MNWITLEENGQIEDIIEKSKTQSQVIFKHSTRCATSQLIKGRLERNANPPGMDFYFLDLVRHRQLSNKIAEVFEVNHESPQVLLIRNGTCVYDESHLGIDMGELIGQNSFN